MNQLVTIFTCTYNRAKHLKRLYEKLKEQTNLDFKWLLIDDGSTDGTKEYVDEIQNEKIIDITYVRKENGGLLTGYNRAITYLDTELAVCIDSDDFPPCDMVEIIHRKWEALRKDELCAGIVGLDQSINGEILGKKFAEPTINFLQYQLDPEMRADRKIVVRTDLYKKAAPLREYKGELGISPHMLHMIICETHYFAAINDVLCIVDYQKDGMSSNVLKQYYKSPHYFMDLRDYTLRKEIAPFKRKILDSVHYTSSCFLCHCVGEKFFFMPKKYITWPLLPVGFILSRYIKYVNEKGSKF